MLDADAAALARRDDDRAVLVDAVDVELGAPGEARIPEATEARIRQRITDAGGEDVSLTLDLPDPA